MWAQTPHPDEDLPEQGFPPLPEDLWVAWLATQIAKEIVSQRHSPKKQDNLDMLRWVWYTLAKSFDEPDDPEQMRKDIIRWARQFTRKKNEPRTGRRSSTRSTPPVGG